MWQAMKHTHEAVGPRLSGEACNEKALVKVPIRLVHVDCQIATQKAVVRQRMKHACEAVCPGLSRLSAEACKRSKR